MKTPETDTVVLQATILLAEYLGGKPGNGSKWITVDESHLMRVDTFANTVTARVFGKDQHGVIQLGNPYVITEPALLDQTPTGEFDPKLAEARFDKLMSWDKVRLRAEAWIYMRSGDTLIGMSEADIAEFILGWEIEKHPERFRS